MSWPNPPYPFANATSPEQMAFLDQMFDQVGAMINIPCNAAGTNAISLTPNVNCPALTAYKELGGYRFRAAATSTGAVTIQYNGLGFLPAYKADGSTQASVGDLVIGEQYIATYSAALNGGLGGFFLESPSIPVNPVSNWFSPGGRLTLLNSTPVMFSNAVAVQNIFYVPYIHPFVPIYNGSNVQMYQFTPSLAATTGLTLSMAGAANFGGAAPFDVFVTLISGSPALVAIAWTNNTTRALTLSLFAGFLTNSGSATVQTGPNTSQTLLANQGTFLGTFYPSAQGTTQFIYGSAASGGGQALLYLCNYYNKVFHDTLVTDNGASYTYSSATIRAARGSATNSIVYVSSDSERAMIVSYNALQTMTGNTAFTTTGIGVNTTTAFNDYQQYANANIAGTTVWGNKAVFTYTATGAITVSANEQSDGVNANTFNKNSANVLNGALWL
jgi:hypothetical protein